MCAPQAVMVGGMMAMSALSSGMQIMAQNQQAKALSESANAAAQADYQALAERQKQIYDKAKIEKFERMRQGIRERAKIRLSAGESGLAGITPAREVVNSFLQEFYDTSIINDNAVNGNIQTDREGAKVQATAKSRINEAKSRMNSSLSAGLQIVSSGARGAMAGQSMYQSFH